MFRIFSDPKMLFTIKKFLCTKNRSRLLELGGGVLVHVCNLGFSDGGSLEFLNRIWFRRGQEKKDSSPHLEVS